MPPVDKPLLPAATAGPAAAAAAADVLVVLLALGVTAVSMVVLLLPGRVCGATIFWHGIGYLNQLC
jgi:hypothetical protein